MTSTKRRFFLAGGLSVAIAIVLGIMLGMSALAAPSSRVRGTLELTDSDKDPVSIISSNTDIVGVDDRTVTVTVEDPDINALMDVGDTDNGADFSVEVTVTGAVGAGDNFAIALSGTSPTNIDPPEITDADDDATTTPTSDDILPIVGDVTIVGNSDVLFVRVLDAESGLILLSANNALTSANDNQTFTLKYRTSDNEATTVEVAGENDTMQLALPENMDDQGKYTRKFIVADTVTIDLNNIREEQQFFEDSLKSDEESEHDGAIPDDQTGATFTIYLPDIPLADSDDGDKVFDNSDVSISPSNLLSVTTANQETGEVEITIDEDETPSDHQGTEFTVTYNAGEQFTIKLDNAPVRGMTTTTVHVARGDATGTPPPDVDTLVTLQGEESPAATALVEVVAPGPVPASDLYKAISFNPVTGALTLAVRKDTPRDGLYIGVNYGVSIEAVVNTATSTATLSLTSEAAKAIMSTADNTHFDVIVGNAEIPDQADAVSIESKDGEVTGVTITLEPTGNNTLSEKDKLYVVYDPDGSHTDDSQGPWNIPAPRGYNPKGSLYDTGDTPIVKALAGGTVTVTYEDNSPRGKVRETITIDGKAPAFEEAGPASGSTFSDDDDVALTIRISDAAGMVNTSTIKVFVAHSTDMGDAPSSGDLIYDDPPSDTASIEYDDLDVEESNGGYVITLNLDDLLRDTAVSIDTNEENFYWWWVQAEDMSGNEGISDAKADDTEKGTNLGSQPYRVTVDLKAPTLAEDGTRTGDWWDPDADDVRGTGDNEKTYSGKLKADKRDSIRVVFDEAMDGDSVDPSDFRVSIDEDNLAVVDALHYTPEDDTHKDYSDLASSVFLVLSAPLDSDATPKVTLAGSVFDLSGRAVSRGNVTAEDGIAPGVTIEVSHEVSSGDLKITVTTDEDITRSAPVLELWIAPDEKDAKGEDGKDGKRDKVGGEGDDADDSVAAELAMTVGGASRVGRTNVWVFSPSFDDDESQTYSVLVSNATDRSGNEGTAGNADPDKTGAVTFEIDNVLPKLVPQEKNDDGDVIKGKEGDFRPGEGDEVSMTDPYYITIDWTSEGTEYPGDSQKAVTLTMAVLNSDLDDDTKTERNLMADAITLDEGKSEERTIEGEDLVSVRSSAKFTIAVSNIGIGDHTLTINGMDSQGNTLEDDAVLKFKVEEQPMFKLELNAGMNLVSIPNTPADTDINAVLGEYEEIDLVITRSDGVWLTATRDADTGMFEATGTATDLTTIDAQHAYYVRTTAPVDVEVDIPSAGIIREIPSISAKGGQWNLVPVISILPIGTNEGEIKAGDELDADEYFGSVLRIFTFANGRIVDVNQGQPNDPDTDVIDTTDKGPVYTNDENSSTGAEFGMGYWVFYDFDHTILP